MKQSAQITHITPGRIRFKVPAKRRDSSFFEELQIDCSSLDGVEHVTANAITGSVLLLCDNTKQDLLIARIKNHPMLDFGSKAHQAGKSSMTLTANEQRTAAQEASSTFASLDATLKEFSFGFLDLRSVLFISFIMFATRQLTQGAVFGNAITLFWYAIQLLRLRKP